MYMYKKLNLLCLMILAGNCGDLFSMDKELDREPPARGSKWLAIRSDHEELWDGLISLDLAAIEKFANKTTVNFFPEINACGVKKDTLYHLFEPYNNAKRLASTPYAVNRDNLIRKSVMAMATVLPLCLVETFSLRHLLLSIEITAQYRDSEINTEIMLNSLFDNKWGIINNSIQDSEYSNARTPLSVAIVSKNYTALRLLLTKGADVLTKINKAFNTGFTTAYKQAEQSNDEEIKKIFAFHGYNMSADNK
jgi:ankyrin repeat protein